ncbi:Crp/Fnr family transcriptional regulator [Rhodoplanes sp. SY1]|uniref:Crp/Fnr family transcriptional regulator n=1 Tax=Rhodoplanes sp. SY1 TaxID=3166646 RepID=UPI0038B69237
MINDFSGTASVAGIAFRQQPAQIDDATGNRILAGLSTVARDRLAPHVRVRVAREGLVLWETGTRSDRIYFPVSATVLLVVPVGSGAQLEVGTIGLEGACGFDADLVPGAARPVVRIGGLIASLPAREFDAAVRDCPELGRIAPACTAWLLAQAQQIAVCNATHTAEQRFARWLARTAQATGRDTVAVTQETVAELLGLRRTTVTLIAQTLQTAGIIRYRRGIIAIVDPAGLKATACPCGETFGPAFQPADLLAAASRPAGPEACA